MPDQLLQGVVRRVTFSLQTLVFTTRNPLTGFERQTLPSDSRWDFTCQLERSDRDIWAEFEAFETMVRQQSGFFTAFDPANYQPRGRPLVDIKETECVDVDGNVEFIDGGGFEAIGERIQIDQAGTRGETNVRMRNLLGESRVFRANDLFSILHGQQNIPMLYKVLQDARSDGTEGVRDGRATLMIAPGLRYPVAAGDEVVVYKPRSVFQFTRAPTSTRTYPLHATMSFRAVESPEILDLVDMIP